MEAIDTVNAYLLLGSMLVVAGIFSSLIARRFGAPLLLVFIVLGMVAGEDGPGNIHFNDYQLTYLIGSIALAIILFDGGLRTKLAVFRDALAPSLLLATLGLIITAGLAGAFAYLVFDLKLLESLLMGAIVASTDAAAVFFLLHSGGLQLRPRVNSVLEIESGTNDPLAVILTVALTQAILVREGLSEGHNLALMLLLQGTVGTAIGLLGGAIAASLLNRLTLPAGLHPIFVVAMAILTYAISSLLGGSGFLAVYLAGLVLGNRPIRAYPSITAFHDAATWLAQIVMFLVLGLLVTPSRLITFIVPALLAAAFLIFIARPIAVWLCISPFGFRESEKAFISWIGLRGAVSIFLAAIPLLSGVPAAAAFFNVAFFVVLVSLIVQGWTITFAARRLGVALAQREPAVDRIELDLPGQLDFELVGYPIAEGSPIAARRARLPPRVRPVMVIRGGDIISPEAAGRLAAGDYAYFLAPPARVPRLDRLMAEGSAPESADAGRPVFGEFAISGEARLGEIAPLYELDVPAEDGVLTVAELFARRFDGRPLAGDQINLGEHATLVARRVDDDTVRTAGLQLEEMMEAIVSIGIPRLAAKTTERIKAFFAGFRR